MDLLDTRRWIVIVKEYHQLSEVDIPHEDRNVELIEDEIMENHSAGRRSSTAEEYQHTAEVGILHEDDRVELVEGEIVESSLIEVAATPPASTV